MLPLHSQDTAAVNFLHWADQTSNTSLEAMFLLNRRAYHLPSSYSLFILLKHILMSD